MSVERAKLLTEALKLPETDRATLAGELLESLDNAVDDNWEQAWGKEISERLDQLKSGRAKRVPWSEARARLLAKIGGR